MNLNSNLKTEPNLDQNEDASIYSGRDSYSPFKVRNSVLTKDPEELHRFRTELEVKFSELRTKNATLQAQLSTLETEKNLQIQKLEDEIKLLKLQNSNLNKDYKLLSDLNTDQNKRISLLTEERDSLLVEISKLKSQLSLYNISEANSTRTKEQLTAEIAKLREDFNDILKDRDYWRDLYQRLKFESEKQIKIAKENFDTSMKERNGLHEQVLILVKERNELKFQLENLQKKYSENESKLQYNIMMNENYKRENEKLNQKIADLERMLAEKMSEIEKLRDIERNYNLNLRILEKLQKENEENKRELEELRERLRRTEAEKYGLEENLKRLKLQLDLLLKDKDAKQKDLDDLLRERDDLLKQLRDLKLELADERRKNKNLEGNLLLENENLRKAREERDLFSKRLNEVNKEFEKFRLDSMLQLDAYKNLQNKLFETQKIQKEDEEELERCRKEIALLKEKNLNFEMELGKTNDLVFASQTNTENQDRLIEALEGKLDDMKAFNNKLNLELMKMRENDNNQKAELAKYSENQANMLVLISQYEKFKENLKPQIDANEKLVKRVTELQNQLDLQNMKNESYKNNLKNLINELEKKTDPSIRFEDRIQKEDLENAKQEILNIRRMIADIEKGNKDVNSFVVKNGNTPGKGSWLNSTLEKMGI